MYFRSRFYHMSTALARNLSSLDMVSSHHLLPHPLLITNFSSTNITEILKTPTFPTRIHTAEQHIIIQTLGGDNTSIPHTSSTRSPIQARRPILACRAACWNYLLSSVTPSTTSPSPPSLQFRGIRASETPTTKCQAMKKPNTHPKTPTR